MPQATTRTGINPRTGYLEKDSDQGSRKCLRVATGVKRTAPDINPRIRLPARVRRPPPQGFIKIAAKWGKITWWIDGLLRAQSCARILLDGRVWYGESFGASIANIQTPIHTDQTLLKVPA